MPYNTIQYNSHSMFAISMIWAPTICAFRSLSHFKFVRYAMFVCVFVVVGIFVFFWPINKLFVFASSKSHIHTIVFGMNSVVHCRFLWIWMQTIKRGNIAIVCCFRSCNHIVSHIDVVKWTKNYADLLVRFSQFGCCFLSLAAGWWFVISNGALRFCWMQFSSLIFSRKIEQRKIHRRPLRTNEHTKREPVNAIFECVCENERDLSKAKENRVHTFRRGWGKNFI